MTCRKSATLLDAFLDGELPQDQMLSFEEHLSTCDTCQERSEFEAGLRSSLRHAVRESAVVSDGFEARLAGALRAERERLLGDAAAPARPARRWPAAIPLSLAAMATMGAVAWMSDRESAQRTRADLAPPPPSPAPVVENPEQVLDQLVDFHAAPPEPQVTEPRLLERLEPEVGVPLRLPELKSFGAAWEGGSVVPLRNQRAAIFRYRLSNHPVSVYVYDARRVPLRGLLEPRVVRNTPVHVGERRGYSIVAREQRGVGYAVATDLNDVESAEIATAMY
jgi:anti-sigma factor RsiW